MLRIIFLFPSVYILRTRNWCIPVKRYVSFPLFFVKFTFIDLSLLLTTVSSCRTCLTNVVLSCARFEFQAVHAHDTPTHVHEFFNNVCATVSFLAPVGGCITMRKKGAFCELRTCKCVRRWFITQILKVDNLAVPRKDTLLTRSIIILRCLNLDKPFSIIDFKV